MQYKFLKDNCQKPTVQLTLNTADVVGLQPVWQIHVNNFCSTNKKNDGKYWDCLLYTSPSPRDGLLSRMPSSA